MNWWEVFGGVVGCWNFLMGPRVGGKVLPGFVSQREGFGVFV